MPRHSPDIIFVNRFFWPDHSATAQILTDVAQHLAQSDFRVRIITSRMLYSDPGQVLTKTENWEGVEVSRVWTTRFGRSNMLGRALDYLTFYASAFFSVLRHADKNSIVISKTDPPLIGIPIGYAARLKGAQRGNWFQDVYPEVAEASGMKLPSIVFRLLKWMRRRSIDKAAINVAIGDLMAAKLKREIAPSNITVIPNFADDASLHPDPLGWLNLRKGWGFSDSDFVVGYSGNLGRAHDVQTLLGAAECLQDDPCIKFLLVGGGHQRQLVEDACAARGLSKVFFRPYQPRDSIALSLSVPDLHWISLKPAFEGLIVPSKLYGIAAVGRPVLMIGARDGEVAQLLEKYGFGTTVIPGDVEAAVSEISRLSLASESLREMKQNAREFVDIAASRKSALTAWRDKLLELSGA
ncbi:glycosyltransferase family 4 protein [Thalassovita mediterranea]|nr:glycosyltransferase family 4 protein [Thalassovita mediterranea]